MQSKSQATLLLIASTRATQDPEFRASGPGGNFCSDETLYGRRCVREHTIKIRNSQINFKHCAFSDACVCTTSIHPFKSPTRRARCCCVPTAVCLSGLHGLIPFVDKGVCLPRGLAPSATTPAACSATCSSSTPPRSATPTIQPTAARNPRYPRCLRLDCASYLISRHAHRGICHVIWEQDKARPLTRYHNQLASCISCPYLLPTTV